MIDDRVKQLHGRLRMPFPCSYCYYRNPEIKVMSEHRACIITAFEDDLCPDGARIKVFCDAGLNAPTSIGDCERFAFNECDVRPHCESKLFDMFDKYALAVISEAYEGREEGVPTSRFTNRETKGYHTRMARIRELSAKGIVDIYHNGQRNAEYARLTQMGQRLAEPIRNLYDVLVDVIQNGDILDDPEARDLFGQISGRPGISDEELVVPTDPVSANRTLAQLAECGYIHQTFDMEGDPNRLLLTPTDLGRAVFKRRG